MAEVSSSPAELLQRIEALERELNLKQLQINRLLNITQAINNNLKFEDLFQMFQSFLSWEMGITKMALFIRDKTETDWICPVFIGIQQAFIQANSYITRLFPQYARLTKLTREDHPFLREFDVIIPVMHKDQPIAYMFLGNLDQEDGIYHRVQFINTIVNVVAVALENKRLFKRQLEQERLKREMELASDIQRMLVPEVLPESPHFEVASIYQPQLGVGGDYFDFILLDERRLGFCVADISGKGLAAAMIMSNFQASLHSLLLQHLPIDILIRKLNDIVFRITHGSRFITFFYAEYDTTTRELQYINAGHVPSLLVHEGQLKQLDCGCTLLGSFEELPSVEVGCEQIAPDTLILSYTDGLTDLKNDNGEFLNEQLLLDFTRLHHPLHPGEFNHQLMQRMEVFRGQQPFPDDVTVLTCRLK